MKRLPSAVLAVIAALLVFGAIGPNAYAWPNPAPGAASVSGVWNVADFSPNGTCNSAYIQQAINSANASGSQAEVYIPSASCSVTSTITLPANIRLAGAGASTILNAANGLDANVISSTANGVRLSNLVINGNRSGNTAGAGISFTGSSDAILDNVTVHDAAADGIYLSGVTRAHLEDVSAYDNTDNGIDLLGASAYVNIDGSKVYDNGQASGSGVDIAGSTLRTTLNGVSAYDDQGTPTQTYGVTEAGTADYTVIAGLGATGNITAATNLTGSHSVNVQTPTFSDATCTNCTINGSTISAPVLSGACTAASAGSAGLSSSQLQISDGSTCQTYASSKQYGVSSAGAVSLSTLTNTLAADVALTTALTYYDGPKVAQGTTGTWCASGSILGSGNSGDFIRAKLWDGSTIIDSNEQQVQSNGFANVALSGCLASPAGNLRISVTDTTTSTSPLIKANATGLGKDSTITVWRVA